MSGRGLEIEDLSIAYRSEQGLLRVLRNIGMRIPPGEIVGLVGESGSGKSTLAYSIAHYLSPNAKFLGGSIRLDGEDLLAAGARRLEELRGGQIGMVYQDPATALNPTLRLGEQLTEGLRRHKKLSRAAAVQRGSELLTRAKLPDPARIMRSFPHEVSGGEKQRVVIAMALACDPRLLIFDEPTTALDATTAAGILDLIRGLGQEGQVATLYISHDLGILAQIVQHVCVIYAGQIIEEGPVERVLRSPLHPYTRMLMASVPNPHAAQPRRRLVSFAGLPADLRHVPQGCIFQSRCPFVIAECRTQPMRLPVEHGHRAACIRLPEIARETLPKPASPRAERRRLGSLLRVEKLSVRYGRHGLVERLLRRPPHLVHAVNDADLTIDGGETVGLVGETGCGKSTLARALVGLAPYGGTIRLNGKPIETPAHMSKAYRRDVQIVFQHPDLSLNPRLHVGTIVGRPIALYEGFGGRELRDRVAGALEQVRLPAEYAKRFPHELSGGEKQRVSIARAFAPRPRLVLCDEITSGLDVSVQASIVNLLADLQDEHGTACLFISHDLNLVQHIADRLVVMYLGQIVESRKLAERGLAPPFHPYTEILLSAAPIPEPMVEARHMRIEGPLPSPAEALRGCPFHTRCPRKIGDVCVTERPPLWEMGPGHRIACHIPREELASVPPIWHPAARIDLHPTRKK